MHRQIRLLPLPVVHRPLGPGLTFQYLTCQYLPGNPLITIPTSTTHLHMPGKYATFMTLLSVAYIPLGVIGSSGHGSLWLTLSALRPVLVLGHQDATEEGYDEDG
jgi:hypothetical protein